MRKLRENLLHWVWHFRGLALLLPIAVMVIVAGCVYPTVKDETSLMWEATEATEATGSDMVTTVNYHSSGSL